MTNTPTIPPCDIDYWREEVDPVITQFLDTAEVAASTSRISLASILLELRQIYREFERLDVPDCLMEEFRDLRRGMAYAVDGFNLFLGRDEIASQVYLEFATIYLWDAYERLFQRLLFSDVRLSNAAVFIWGGPDPNPATATWLAQTSTPTPG